MASASDERADWEIWSGQGLALLTPALSPDKAWLTRVLVRRYVMPDVTQAHADAVFQRALRGGYLIHWPKPRAPDETDPAATDTAE